MAFKIWLAGSAMALGVGAFGAANASTINFSDLGSGSCAYLGSSAVSGGMNFSDVSGGGLFLCDGNVIHNGSTPAIIAANTTSILDLNEADNSLFSVESFDAGSRLYSTATGVDLVGTTLDGSVFQHLTFSGENFSSFTLDPAFTGLTRLRITATGSGRPEFLVNNIVVNEGGAGAVPEPASWALMLVGFMGAGSMVRSRRVRGAVAA
jgi:hypothetical protein